MLTAFPSEKETILIQNTIQENFSKIKYTVGEIGTCKKMNRLSLLNEEWAHLALVYNQQADFRSIDIVQQEEKYLRYLAEHHYPVVKVLGSAFILEKKDSEITHFGMLMNYIPGVFMEAKTEAPLKHLILCALLGITTRAQESWFPLNKIKIEKEIIEKTKQDSEFFKIQKTAKILSENFYKLINLFEKQKEMISDLQLIISEDGTLTIIDPLDIIEHQPEHSFYQSRFRSEDIINTHCINFLTRTRHWLETAQYFCFTISEMKSSDQIRSQLEQGSSSLFFSRKGDPLGKSRVSQLQSGHNGNSTHHLKFK